MSGPHARQGGRELQGAVTHASKPTAPAHAELDRRVGVTCAGNPRPIMVVPTPKLEVLPGQHSIAEHVARAGSQQVFAEDLLGKGRCVLPSAGLEPRIQRGELRPEPCLSHLWLLAHRFPRVPTGVALRRYS